jgi:uncharacterized protein
MYKYRKPRKQKSKLRTSLLFVSAVIIFLLGYQIGNMNERVVIYKNETKSLNVIKYIPYGVNDSYSNASFASIVIPAVDDEGNGVTTVLTVQIIPGEGRVLANIDKLLFWTDTQNSIRTSSRVASNITGVDLSDYDIIYTIETNATAVEGPSAGAAITIATIAALEHKPINPEVLITGAINHDGTIGPVGQILPKAHAAKEIGADLFLVPLLQSQEITYETRKYCERVGLAEICTTEKVPKKVDISEEADIEVKEVENIEEALDYFWIGD